MQIPTYLDCSITNRNVSANRNTTTSKYNTDHTDEDLQTISITTRTLELLLTINMYAVALLIIALMIGIKKIIKAIRKKCKN